MEFSDQPRGRVVWRLSDVTELIPASELIRREYLNLLRMLEQINKSNQHQAKAIEAELNRGSGPAWHSKG